jgi:hypothetical protein
VLTSDQLDSLSDPIAQLYARYEDSIIRDIARRLGKMGGVTETAAWQMQRLVESGAIYDNALEEIARLTGQSETVLRQMFQKAGVTAMRFDDSIYRAAGLNPLPLNLSPAMAQVLRAGLEKTGGIMRNLTMTTAMNAKNSFIEALDLAYMQVSTGAMSYTEAIREAVKGVAAQGIRTVSYAGHTDQLDVAIRRAVLTGINQTAGRLQETRADQMGCDLVQTSAHIGARPSHQVWQGQVFSRSGMDRRYPPFVESTGYGTGAGLAGYNCRHSFYPFFDGISQNAYSQADRDSFASKTVTYNGQQMSVYDATQKQRYIERGIRHWKRQAEALDAAKKEAEYELAKVREWQARMRDLLRQTKLQRDRIREQI